MNDIINGIESLNTLPPLLLVGLLCIVLGYVLKLVPSFPNGAIPLCVVVAGGILNAIMTEIPAEVANAKVLIVRGGIIGFIVGFITWMFHASVLRNYETKIPILGGLLANTTPPTNTTPKPPTP